MDGLTPEGAAQTFVLLFSESLAFFGAFVMLSLFTWMILQPLFCHRPVPSLSWYLLVVQPMVVQVFTTECWHVYWYHAYYWYSIAFYQLWINIDDCPTHFLESSSLFTDIEQGGKPCKQLGQTCYLCITKIPLGRFHL